LCGAIATGAVALLLYRATLLPGLDFGDTAFLQSMAGSPIISPRNAYPLYFAVAGALLPVLGGDPARAVNLVTAVESAAACGVLALLATELAGQVLAGVASALLFAVSYTFWSQSVIAEVYGLHMLCVATTLLVLLRWAARPTTGRLLLFFAVYAVSFGNHLSMILLLPACTLFLLTSAPGGWRTMLRGRVVALAIAVAAAGALQYAWNLRTLWFAPAPPHSPWEALTTAWFDITKSDWRETLVLQVPRSMFVDRAAMYVFDLRQQFGWPGIGIATVGCLALWIDNWRRAALVSGVYLANILFAYAYNVGDTHVFYLPSHLMVALLTAPGLMWIASYAPAGHVQRARTILALLLVAYAGTRMYRDCPALDRSGDTRPTDLLRQLTAGLDDRHAIVLTDLGWQVQNGLDYFERRLHPEVASIRMADVLLHAPALVQDNETIGREVALTSRAAATLRRSFGPLLPVTIDARAPGQRVTDLVADLPNGTPFVLCVLKPTRDFTLDAADVESALARLTNKAVTVLPRKDYVAIAGVAGEAPVLVASSDTPFRQSLDLRGTPIVIRMESWLAADTIRRMGFGQVIASRHHALIVERGVSFVAFGRAGRPSRSGYAAGIFGPEPRYLCYR
jgi:hypothetical protein